MKKHSLTAFLVAAVLAFQAQAASYVGITTTTIAGDSGVIAMSALCNSAFAGARMCTYEEIALTNHRAKKSNGPAWFQQSDAPGHPTFHPCEYAGTTGGQRVAIDGAGRISPLSCGTAQPVTCCK